MTNGEVRWPHLTDEPLQPIRRQRENVSLESHQVVEVEFIDDAIQGTRVELVALVIWDDLETASQVERTDYERVSHSANRWTPRRIVNDDNFGLIAIGFRRILRKSRKARLRPEPRMRMRNRNDDLFHVLLAFFLEFCF